MGKLIVEGRLGHESLKKVADLTVQTGKISVLLFCTYSKDAISLGHVFKSVRIFDDKSSLIDGSFKLVMVTNQLLVRLDEVPYGYKTICQLELVTSSNQIEKFIEDIPIVENWYESERKFIFE